MNLNSIPLHQDFKQKIGYEKFCVVDYFWNLDMIHYVRTVNCMIIINLLPWRILQRLLILSNHSLFTPDISITQHIRLYSDFSGQARAKLHFFSNPQHFKFFALKLAYG